MKQWLWVLALGLAGCGGDGTRQDQQAELFERYVREGNHFGVAALFTEDGVWAVNGVEAARGRKAIQQHLAAGRKVKSYDHDVVGGVFQEQVEVAPGRVVETQGRLEAEWVQSEGGRWLLKRWNRVTAAAPER